MYFRVTFKTRNKGELLDSIGSAGLDILDLVRAENPDIAHLDIDDIHIDTECPLHGNMVESYLFEEMARKSGLFKGRQKVEIIVPDLSLTRYSSWCKEIRTETVITDPGWPILRDFMNYEKIPGRKTKERVYNASFKQVFDYDQLVKDWEAAGFPLEWTP